MKQIAYKRANIQIKFNQSHKKELFAGLDMLRKYLQTEPNIDSYNILKYLANTQLASVNNDSDWTNSKDFVFNFLKQSLFR